MGRLHLSGEEITMLKRSCKDASTPLPRARLTAVGFALAAASLAIAVPATAATTSTATTSSVTATTSIAPQAVAAPGAATAKAPSNCPLGCLCGYTRPNYVGSMAAFTEGCLQGDNLDLNVPGDVWNNVASIFNNGAYDNVKVYRNTDYSHAGGHWACLYKGTGFANMQSQLPGIYHHLWSNYWVDTPCT
jgi:Peptidase inhibitor family I36